MLRFPSFTDTDDDDIPETMFPRSVEPPVSQRLTNRRNRQPVPYQIHARTLSTQQREAERRRAAMTPTASPVMISHHVRVMRYDYYNYVPNNNRASNKLDPNKLTRTRKTTQIDLTDSCVICLGEYKLHMQIRTLQCSHKFHTQCIDKWFETSLSCPICRTSIDGKVDGTPCVQQNNAIETIVIEDSDEENNGNPHDNN